MEVLAIPTPNFPLFPGSQMIIIVQDAKFLSVLLEILKRPDAYVGVFLVREEAQADPSVASSFPSKELFNHLHKVGTLSKISCIHGDQVFVTGHQRICVTGTVSDNPRILKVVHLEDMPYNKDDDILKAVYFAVLSNLKDVPKSETVYRDHLLTFTENVGDSTYPGLAGFAVIMCETNKFQCQQVLEELDMYKCLTLALELVMKKVRISKIQESIVKETEEKISGKQRRDLLNEQLITITKELELETNVRTALIGKFKERIESKREKCLPQVLQVIDEELSKLQWLDASSLEFTITRNYLDWLTALPWGVYSDENFDVNHAQEILDEHHYGLADVKERVLEFIAVWKLRGSSQGKIICLSGPPGVGKRSIGRSIASALNRKFYCFSVRGLGDVAQIKGHQRTYTGAMPGQLVQCLKNVGTANPLVLIDEIDKLGSGRDADPASALLELLDPGQNANFLDHYLDVPIDLSKVLFICTANVVENIPKPLLDRMEIIIIADYITDEKDEKMRIVRDYLEKTAREECGIKPGQVEVTDAALLALMENYCPEAGVRNLQMYIKKIYKNIALQLVRKAGTIEPAIDVEDAKESEEDKESELKKTIQKVLVDITNLTDFVGKPIFHAECIYDQTPIGVVMGLFCTGNCGSTLYIETTLSGKGEQIGALHLTGQLGDVMKESAQIAHTVARAILREKEPQNNFFANSGLHLHIPPGATRKDGPSAGCAMVTSLLSFAMKKLVRKNLAMTGEVTLTGRILPVNGVKEKAIAARRNGVKTIIFPSANRRDFYELANNVKEVFDVHFVDHYMQIYDLAWRPRVLVSL